jgi:hypothetical protein
VREDFPELGHLVDSLLGPMNFSLFYGNGPETACNTNPAVPDNQPTGQMFGGYYVGLPPNVGDDWTHHYHNGAFYSDPRISAYKGMGHVALENRAMQRHFAADTSMSWAAQLYLSITKLAI